VHGSEPDLEVVRQALEAAISSLGPGSRIDLLGTTVDGGILRVVVRSRRDGSVHLVAHDVAEIREGAEARTLDRLVDELMFRSIHHQDLQLVSTSSHLVQEWH